MGKGGFHLSSKTICPVCEQPIKRTLSHSYSCAWWLGWAPAHLDCAAQTQPAEMAATNGEETA